MNKNILGHQLPEKITNQELANILFEIAFFLEMEEAAFRPQAYEKAAIVLENLNQDAAQIYDKGGEKALIAIPGIGKSIAHKIEEYLKTGKIKYYEELRKKTPIDIEGLSAIEGIGPKTIKTLYYKLGVRNLKDLERVAKKNKIAKLYGFGQKKEKDIIEAINFLKKTKRFSVKKAFTIAQGIKKELSSLPAVKKVDIAGSLRRKRATIGDIDFLATSSQPKKVIDFLINLPGVIKVWGKGKTKASIRFKENIDIDLRVVPEKSYGAALQYFTGSKEHNIILRKIAIQKGMKLNEYGLFKKDRMVAGKNEKEIYTKLGLKWVLPEKRLGKDEFRFIKK